MSTSRKFILAAAVLLALATALGAFGAHALRTKLSSARYDSFEIAVTYQFFHALGLLGIGLLLRQSAGALLRWAGWTMLAGLTLFSGSIYALTFGAPPWFGVVAPLGGLSLIVAWILLAAHAWREHSV
jgi:uncharacterized membrane protein YgdD (TMEM256/DUF423 family)